MLSAQSRRQTIGKEIDRSVFPGQQGGPLMHIVAAKAVALGEALRPEFEDVRRADRRKCAGAGRGAEGSRIPHRLGRDG